MNLQEHTSKIEPSLAIPSMEFWQMHLRLNTAVQTI